MSESGHTERLEAALDGKYRIELFYVNGDREMVAVTFETEPTFRVLTRESLFAVPISHTLPNSGGHYDLHPNDQRFVMVRPFEDATEGSRYMLINGFLEELRARVPN